MRSAVIVGYDHMPHTTHALDEAGAEAARRGGVLTVLHAFQSTPSASAAGSEGAADEAARALALWITDQGAERARSRHPGLEVRTRTVAGSPEAALSHFARDADLLVVGCRTHATGLVLDSVAARVAARPVCPTMIVNSRRHERRGTVLAAVDIDDPSEEILAFAFAEARLRRTGLKTISVRESFWPRTYAGDTGGLRVAAIQADDNAELALHHLLSPWQAKYPGVHVRHELVNGPVGTVLTTATLYADLVVMGAHHHPLDGLPIGDEHVGPVIHPVLLRAHCPVVIVPRGPVRAESRAQTATQSRQ